MRINGIGVTYLGISRTDETGCCEATLWFTFLFAPLFPLARHRLRRHLSPDGRFFRYERVAKTPLLGKEILRTYLFGWLLFPLLLFWPGVLAFREVWQGLGLPESLYTAAIAFAIVWLIVFSWKLMDWHEARLPDRPPKQR